jgi:hypothetical protein
LNVRNSWKPQEFEHLTAVADISIRRTRVSRLALAERNKRQKAA